MQPKSIFLAIEGSFSKLALALFINLNLIEKVECDNLRASSLLLQSIENLLNKNSVKLSDLNFISINQGPGAFTSLRVTIATINGISFATKIPLIGVDGLDALTFTILENLKNRIQKQVQHDNNFPEILISCLNAYGYDVHYTINQIDNDLNLKKIKENQCHKIDRLIENINKEFADKTILFGGNGATLHKNKIEESVKNSMLLFDKKVQTASVEQIGFMAFQKWKKEKTGINKLQPLYLKAQTFAVKK